MTNFFLKPMISNGRVVCDYCNDKLPAGDEFDIDEEGLTTCKECYYEQAEEQED